jgi:EAL domain-containing protein (putative c-di-GMP-specific phosphodiesterase class I)/GGDEF domain-containing protein
MVASSPMPDILTGLDSAQSARAWLDAGGAPVQAMLIGLHRFQSVNLAYGIAAGDSMLALAGKLIRDFALSQSEGAGGEEPLVARMGGGVFLVASRTPASRQRWQWLAETLAATLARPLGSSAGDVRLRPRVALLRGLPGEGASVLLDRLDQALSTLEARPGQRLIWADGSHRARGRSAARLEADLLGALGEERGGSQIAVLFQPQFAVADDALVGAEALVRWDHRQLGRIGAEALFAIAERGDHVTQLSRHIAAQAMTAAAGWAQSKRKSGGQFRLSLNVTAADLAATDFAERMREIIAASGFDPACLTLEITEQTLIADLSTSAAALRLMADMGVGIALDDFGSGFANFRMLKALPLDTLKLDATLLADVATDPRDRAILRAIIAMARALGLKVVAEGIETLAQLAVLREEGCDVYQGFLRLGPVSGEALAGAMVGAGFSTSSC